MGLRTRPWASMLLCVLIRAYVCDRTHHQRVGYFLRRNRQAASVVGGWGPRGFPNLAAPAVSGRGAIPIPLGSSDFSRNADCTRVASRHPSNAPAGITQRLCTRAKKQHSSRRTATSIQPSESMRVRFYSTRSALSFLFRSVSSDRDAVDPATQLRERQRVPRRRMLDLNLETHPWRDRVDPAVLLQQAEADDRNFVQAVAGHVDAVADARRRSAADGACLRPHRRRLADSLCVRLRENLISWHRKERPALAAWGFLGQ